MQSGHWWYKSFKIDMFFGKYINLLDQFDILEIIIVINALTISNIWMGKIISYCDKCT